MYGKKYTAQYKIACVEEYLKVKQETGVSIAQFAYDHDSKRQIAPILKKIIRT